MSTSPVKIKEEVWVSIQVVVAEVVVVVTVVDVQWNFTRQFVLSAIRNAKFLSSLQATVRSIVKIAFENAKKADADSSDSFSR